MFFALIQGVYVYDELRDNVDDTAYYGLPRSIDFSGRNKHGHLCTPARPGEKVNVRTDPTCKEMTKIFYLQVSLHLQVFRKYRGRKMFVAWSRSFTLCAGQIVLHPSPRAAPGSKEKFV